MPPLQFPAARDRLILIQTIASIISITAALLWAKTMSLFSVSGMAGIGAIAGILAVTLPEAVTEWAWRWADGASNYFLAL